ncbi:MAG: P-II family nitrogen regulator [Lactobacillales bacterium]|jgi:nitrogen regulatory protein P-II 1|nr:P-II family nitrogen regulator [Lactobacillales bacterium]
MKKIEAIIREEKLEDLKIALNELIDGMTISQILGYGKQRGFDEYVRGKAVPVQLLRKIKVEIVVTDDRVQTVIDKIIATCQTGEVGDGKIFVIPVENAIRISTNTAGDAAVTE